MSLEDIDLLFGERALGTLPDDLHKDGMVLAEDSAPVASEVETKPKVEVEGAVV